MLRITPILRGVAAVATAVIITSMPLAAQPRVDANPTIDTHSEPMVHQMLKRRLTEWVDLCRDNKLVVAAGYVAYQGADTLRHWRDTCRSKRADERAMVVQMCGVMRALLDSARGYGISGYEHEMVAGQETIIVSVIFMMKQGGSITRGVRFVSAHGRYVVAAFDLAMRPAR